MLPAMHKTIPREIQLFGNSEQLPAMAKKDNTNVVLLPNNLSSG
jgi:hypothetical protein